MLAAVVSAPVAAPALAVDLEALNEDIMRVADPERYYKDASKVELERQLGAPGSPVNAPGTEKGEDGERDVVTTPSGLSYADVEIGRGDGVKVGDLIVANVVGYTPDGKVFENTYARKTALTFQLGIRPPGVCEGLEEGIRTMRAGGKRLIAVPGSLGFGEAGIRAPLGKVPPNSALRYEVSCCDASQTPQPRWTTTTRPRRGDVPNGYAARTRRTRAIPRARRRREARPRRCSIREYQGLVNLIQSNA